MFNPSIGEVDPSRRSSIVTAEVAKAHIKSNQRNGPEDHLHTSNDYVGYEFELSHLRTNPNNNQTINGKVQEYNVSTIEENSEDEDHDDSVYPNGYVPLLVVFGGFLSCFTLFGIMNSVGAIESYIQVNQLANASVTAISWVFSIYMFITLFSGLIVGPLYDTFGATYLMIIGTLFTFTGLLACGSSKDIYQFVLSFGVCTGIGSGCLMFPSISVISSWFNRTKRSFYIGLIQTGGSVGGVCFPILLRYLYAKYGFVWAMRIFAFFNLGVCSVACIFVRDRINEIRELTNEPIDDRTFWEKFKNSFDIRSFKDKKFIVLTAALFMNEFSLLIVITYLASYAIANGASISESYVMITIMNVSGTFGKFIPSYFAQRYGCFNMMIIMSVSMTIECFVIWLPFGKHKGALYLFIVLFGFAYAATYSLTGATIGAITPKTKDFGKRYGSAYAIVSFGNLISLPISGAFIVNRTASDYDNMVAFAASTCALASVLFLFSRYTIVGRKLRCKI